MDIDRFMKDPSLLVDLCRHVIGKLQSRSDQAITEEQEAQMAAIAKAVEQLEKSGVPVPDPLRAEKTRLVTALALHADAKQALIQLADEFQDIVTDLRDRSGTKVKPSKAQPATKRNRLARTAPDVLRKLIIQCLKARGGRARISEVIADLGVQLGGKFLPGDLVLRKDGRTIAWQNNAQWERLRMRHEGLLRSDSPQGIWELSEDTP